MEIWIGGVTKKLNSTSTSGTFTVFSEVYLKDDVSIYDPVFCIDYVANDLYNAIMNCNMVRAQFGDRAYYYNIYDIVIKEHTYYLYCHIDVLATYAKDIRNHYFLYERAPNSNPSSTISAISDEYFGVENGFSSDTFNTTIITPVSTTNAAYIITYVSKSGGMKCISVEWSVLKALMKNLYATPYSSWSAYASTSAPEGFTPDYVDPSNFIKSIKQLPISPYSITSESAELDYIGWTGITVLGSVVKAASVGEGSDLLTKISIKTGKIMVSSSIGSADKPIFAFKKDYVSINLNLGTFGEVEIDPEDVFCSLSNSKVDGTHEVQCECGYLSNYIDYEVLLDPSTGAADLILKLPSGKIISISANIARDVFITSSQNRVAQGVASVGKGVASAFSTFEQNWTDAKSASELQSYSPGVVSNIIGGVKNIIAGSVLGDNTTITQIGDQNGDLMTTRARGCIKYRYTYYKPVNVNETVGRKCNNVLKAGTNYGYYKVFINDLSIQAPENVRDELNRHLLGGFYNEY